MPPFPYAFLAIFVLTCMATSSCPTVGGSYKSSCSNCTKMSLGSPPECYLVCTCPVGGIPTEMSLNVNICGNVNDVQLLNGILTCDCNVIQIASCRPYWCTLTCDVNNGTANYIMTNCPSSTKVPTNCSRPVIGPAPGMSLQFLSSVSVGSWNRVDLVWSSMPASTALTWTISPGPQLPVNTSSNFLLFPPYSLTPSQQYTVVLMAVTFTQGTFKISGSFNTILMPLVLVIDGGNRQIVQGTSWLLNASGSYDPNTAIQNQILCLKWTCQFTKLGQAPIVCPTALCDSSQNCMPPLLRVTSALSATLEIGNYDFTLVATTSNNSNTNTTVQARVQLVPALPDITALYLRGPSRVSAGEIMRFSATASGASGITYSWSIKVLNTVVQTDDLTCFPLQTNNRSFLVGAGCLPPTEYNVTCTATSLSGASLSAFILVIIASPPTGTGCVTQGQGNNTVSVDCSSFTANTALSFSFRIYRGVDQIAISDWIASPKASLLLPKGTWTIAVYVTNIVGAFVSTNVSAQVGETFRTCFLAPEATGVTSSAGVSSLLQILQAISVDAPSSCLLDEVAVGDFWNISMRTIEEITTAPYISGALANTIADTALTLVQYLKIPPNLVDPIVDFMFALAEKVATTGHASLSLGKALALLMSLVPCSKITHLLDLIYSLSAKSVTQYVPGETSQISTIGVNVVGSQVFVDTSSSLSGVTTAVTLAADAIAVTDASVLSSLVISEYGSALVRCRPTTIGKIVSSITDVRVEYGLNGTVRLLIPLNTRANACEKLSCNWWNRTEQAWVDTGCVGKGIVGDQYVCECTHLTEFSILLQELRGCRSTSQRGSFVALLFFYVLVGSVCFAKLALLIFSDSCPRRAHGVAVVCTRGRTEPFVSTARKPCAQIWLDSLATQHALMCLLCVLRAVFCAYMAGLFAANASASKAFVLLSPYLVVFWLYTRMVFQWAALYHLPMQKDSFAKIRWIFYLFNAVVVICVGVLAISLLLTAKAAVVSPESPRAVTAARISLAASVIITLVTLLSGIFFYFYASKLAKVLAGAPGNTSSGRESTQQPTTNNPAVIALAKLGSSFRMSKDDISSDSSLPSTDSSGGSAPLNNNKNKSARFLNTGGEAANNGGGGGDRSRFRMPVWVKMKIAAAIVSLVLCLEAVLHVVFLGRAGSDGDEQAREMVAVLALDLLVALVIQALYHKSWQTRCKAPCTKR